VFTVFTADPPSLLETFSMPDKTLGPASVRIIGSRELHQNLPGILKELENDSARFVLTVRGKPRAVLIGAEPYLTLIREGQTTSEALLGLQLTALLGASLDSHSLEDLERALQFRGE
jgi:prevent-host-death family protein